MSKRGQFWEFEIHILEYIEMYSPGEFCTYLRPIAKSLNCSLGYIKSGVQSLRAKGLVEYQRGLMSDDGMVAGSGYRCTDKGRRFCEMFIYRNDIAKELDNERR